MVSIRQQGQSSKQEIPSSRGQGPSIMSVPFLPHGLKSQLALAPFLVHAKSGERRKIRWAFKSSFGDIIILRVTASLRMSQSNRLLCYGLISVSNLANPESPKQLAYLFLYKKQGSEVPCQHCSLTPSKLVTAYPAIDSQPYVESVPFYSEIGDSFTAFLPDGKNQVWYELD